MLRLQKFLAQAGLGSRRSCEQLIRDNKVYVNGKLAVLGTKVTETDEVTFEGERVLLRIADLKVIMLLIFFQKFKMSLIGLRLGGLISILLA